MNKFASTAPGNLADFRRLDTGSQLKQLRGQKAARAFQVDRAAGINEQERTVWLSVASGQPYERWWGIEILDMSSKSIRKGRLNGGLPGLVDHNPADIVSKAQDFEISRGGKLRVLARFGKSARAEEIWQDVLDGIRTDCSIGYVIHDLVLEKQEDNISTYRVTDWEPLEYSLTAIPADPTVGVGRSATTLHQSKGNNMDENEEVTGAPALTRSQRRRGEGDEPQLTNAQAVIAAGRVFASQGGLEVAARVIERGGDETDFKREMFAEQGRRNARINEGWDLTPPESPLNDPTAYGRGMREMMVQPKYFKGPDAAQRAYRSGMFLKAQFGDVKAQRYCRENGIEVRAMSGQQLVQGGALVPGELSSTIIDLADSYGVFRAEADVWPMSSDTLSVPKSTADPEAAFVLESQALPEDEGEWGAVNLSTSKLGTIVRIPTELMEDSVINIADRVAFQLARSFSKKEDQCGFTGDGTSTYGGIQGIFPQLIDGNHDASKVVAATNHDLFSEIDAVDLSNLVAACPEYAVAGAKWYCSNLAWSMVFMRLMMAAGGNAVSDLSGAVPKSYAGFPVVTSPVLPAGASTDYTGLVMLAFGNLRLASKFGSRREIRIQILTETYAAYDQVGISATERFDIVNHGLGDNTNAGPIVGLVGA